MTNEMNKSIFFFELINLIFHSNFFHSLRFRNKKFILYIFNFKWRREIRALNTFYVCKCLRLIKILKITLTLHIYI
jgi:hypothetical protein